MNRNYVDEALDKAGELMRVVHTPAWRLLAEAFYGTPYDEIDDHGMITRDGRGTIRRQIDDRDGQREAAAAAVEGRPAQEAKEMASYLMAELALTLRDGEVFAVDPEIVELLQGAAGTMPPYELRMSDAPCQHGFVWFPDGLMVRDVRGKMCVVKCISWTAAHKVDDDYDGKAVITEPLEPNPRLGYVINVLSDPFDPRDEYHEQYGTAEMHKGMKVPGVRDALHWSPLGGMVWPEGETLMTDAGESMQFIAAFWRFVQEPWVEHRSIEPSNHARKRALRKKRDPSRLRVVRLRKEDHTYERKGDGNPGSVDWSHRWVVKPFWRDQHYPSLGPAKLPDGSRNPDSHRPKYVPSFVKGPKDKPLIIKDTAYLVDR